MKRKENFQWLPKELHQLKYEAISVPQGSVRLVKKTQERKSSTCYLLITKGVTSSSPVPLKTRRERERSKALKQLAYVFEKGNERYCISMTMFTTTSPKKPTQLEKFHRDMLEKTPYSLNLSPCDF
ncbi:uncharacterized protein TNCV_4848291 [Trichonephila clavipes]|nr:uncharacterized protein TNCV_4848291 [Trichonephila clavipes]